MAAVEALYRHWKLYPDTGEHTVHKILLCCDSYKANNIVLPH